MIKHPTLTPDQYRTALQTHLDEVMFVLLIDELTMARVAEVVSLRARIEELLDAAIYGADQCKP